MAALHKGKNFRELKSQLTYGVELEINNRKFNQKEARNHRADLTQHLLPDWTIHGEHCGLEVVSPILQGDDGLNEISKVCAILRDFECDDLCGLHIHIDVRKFTDEQLKRIHEGYLNSYRGWRLLVDKSRWENKYCKNFSAIERDILSGGVKKGLVGAYNNRRRWLNWNAFREHGTMEIRMHEGTTSVKAICNWVLLHINFVEKVAHMKDLKKLDLGTKRKKVNLLAPILDFAPSDKIRKYYMEKAGLDV